MSHDLPVEHPVPGVKPTYSGKVREIYDVGDEMIIVATDRVSTYDVILPDRIVGKGKLLTSLSTYWFAGLGALMKTHFISSDPSSFPAPFASVGALAGRTMHVRKAKRFDVECIVRGYLAGSGLKEYRKHGTVCGLKLPEGLAPYQKLDEPIFTPTTKAESGHDENMTFDEMKTLIGADAAETLRRASVEIYTRASDHARERGVIIADTKFEFGERDGEIILIDEVLTPDSSRFWDLTGYEPGTEPEPMDKQYVRNAVDATGWDHSPPAPALPPEVIAETTRRYTQAIERITRGEARPPW